MDYFEPKTIVIAVTAMVFFAVVLDLLRRKKRNRYENLQMSSRDLDRGSKIEEEQDPYNICNRKITMFEFKRTVCEQLVSPFFKHKK